MLHGRDYETAEVLRALNRELMLNFNRSARETVNALSAEAREEKLNRILGREARARASKEVKMCVLTELDYICGKFKHAFELLELELQDFNIASGSLPLYQDRIRFLESVLERYDDIIQAVGKAYKQKAREHHPDRQGKTKVMQALNQVKEDLLENKDRNKDQLRLQLKEMKASYAALDKLEGKVIGLLDSDSAVKVTCYCDAPMLYLIACYFPHLLRDEPRIHPNLKGYYAHTSLHGLSCEVGPVVIKKILEVSSGIASMLSIVGNTPLHSIIESWMQKLSAEKTRSPYPGLVNYTISYSSYSTEVLSLIMQAYPDALLVENEYGETPLTLALRLANTGRQIKLNSFMDIRNYVPSYECIKNNTPALYIIEYMLSTRVREDFIAALEKNLRDIVRNEDLLTLMISNEKGRELIKRNISSVILEVLAARDNPQEVFTSMLQYEDLKASVLSIDSPELKSNPLLLFIRFTMGEGISECAKFQNANGRTLLHNTLAEIKGVNIDYIIALYKAYPQALSIKDCNGNTPLHIAAMNNPKLVPLLLHWEPKVGFALSKEGKLPVDLLNREEASTEAQKLLNEYAKVTVIVALSMGLGVMALGAASSIYLGIIFKLAEFVVMALCYLTMAVSLYSMAQAPTITEYCSGFFVNLVSKPKVDDIDVAQAAL